jgi:hypothetical protein
LTCTPKKHSLALSPLSDGQLRAGVRPVAFSVLEEGP